MGRRIGFPDVTINLNHGHVYVEAFGMGAEYKPRPWIIHMNPKFLLSGFRKEQRKLIYVNGRKYGFAEFRFGCIPIRPYIFEGHTGADKLLNFIRIKLGLLCKPHEKGYYWIQLRRQKYVVLKRFTQEGNTRCLVYHVGTMSNVGSFVFDREFQNVYPSFGPDSPINSIIVIMGYMAEENVYSSVAQQLNRTIKVKYN